VVLVSVQCTARAEWVSGCWVAEALANRSTVQGLLKISRVLLQRGLLFLRFSLAMLGGFCPAWEPWWELWCRIFVGYNKCLAAAA
jgi:hypothetical protein